MDREAWRVTVHGVSKVKCYLKTKQRQQHMCMYACTGKTPRQDRERGRLEGWDTQIKRCHLLWQMLKNSSGMVTSQEEDLYDEETNQSSYCRDHSTWDILPTGACLWAWVVSTPRARKWRLRPFPHGENQRGNTSICESAIEHKPSCN